MPRTWSEMTPEQKARDLVAHKRRKYLRESGRPSLVPAGPARQKLLAIKATYAVSSRNIAEGTGLSEVTISDLVRGRRVPSKDGKPIERIPRLTHEKVMAYQPDPALYNPKAWVDPTGSRRRLQALACKGFTAVQLADFLGWSGHNQVWLIMRGKGRDGDAEYVYAATRDAITSLYGKYVDVDPTDVGGTPFTVARAQGAARRNGYVPADCWDSDTIDDPGAIPEWTGACGTEEGYRIHVREILQGGGTPPCDACREDVETRAPAPGRFIFNHERFGELLDSSSMSAPRLAEQIGLRDGDAMYRWRTGEYAPKYRHYVQQLADLLRVDESELMTEPERPPKTKPRLNPGEFNPYVFGMALEIMMMPQSKAAKICGASGSSITCWLSGRARPNKRDKLQPLADEFNIPVETFYL